ncbi:MAG: type II toxin-antitoxin system HicB family antitoxin [Elusimicrobia bacterium CG_4_10_14_0_8_um_filter_37_32]|nr:MAG: type II toxin-antitoxin system HicB family antitoxin [Elusimicrobia bacterium CG_4_10_14_0_8_um_filter_37_32]
MKYYNFEVIIEKEEYGEGYYAYCANLPGCFSNGKTIEEAKENIREVIELHKDRISAVLEKR